MALSIEDERRMRRYGLQVGDDADPRWFRPTDGKIKFRAVSFPRMVGAFLVGETMYYLGVGSVIEDGHGYIKFQWRHTFARPFAFAAMFTIADGSILGGHKELCMGRHVFPDDTVVLNWDLTYNHDAWLKWHLENMR